MNEMKNINEKLQELKKNIENNTTNMKQTVDEYLVDMQSKDIQRIEGFDVSNGIKDFSNKMVNIGKGLEKIFKGLFVDEMNGLGKGLYLGFNNIGELIHWTGEYIFANILCGLQFIQNLHKCIFYYTLDCLGKFIYSPVYLINWIAWEFMEKDLEEGQLKIWDSIYALDEEFYKTSGFHFAHYPKNVHDMCYSCKRLKVLALKAKSSQIKYIFDTKMSQLLYAGIQEMLDGAKLMGK